MSRPVFANGHWRRRDMLAGLTAPMRAALVSMALAPLPLREGLYRDLIANQSFTPSTLAALISRGLAEFRFDRRAPATPLARLTRRGRETAAEIARRAAVRQKLTAPPLSRSGEGPGVRGEGPGVRGEG